MNNSYYDIIDELPIDKHKKQTEVELELIQILFKKNQSFFSLILKESYQPFLVACLFLIFSFPYTENIIQSILPITTNLPILLLSIKFIIIMVAYWILKQTLF